MGTINPYREFVASISPTEFEELCLEILKGYAEAEHLSDFSIQHNVSIPADDGTYQIDVYARFIAMGVEFKVIAECKRYSSPVSREKVSVLADKVKSLGAHKGIMISTCGFQSGAYEYAKKHGIALLQVINRNVMHIMNAANPETEEQKQKLYLMLDWYNRMPKYYAKRVCNNGFSGQNNLSFSQDDGSNKAGLYFSAQRDITGVKLLCSLHTNSQKILWDILSQAALVS